jgi:transposase
VPAIPSWLLEPLWDQFAALLPPHPVYAPSHPPGCHRPRIEDRIIFEKLVQVLRFGCSYEAIADCTCGAATIRERRDEWIKAGIFAKLKQVALESYDRIAGLVLQELAIDGCITKAPGGGECAGRSPAGPGQPGTTPRCWPPRRANSASSSRHCRPAPAWLPPSLPCNRRRPLFGPVLPPPKPTRHRFAYRTCGLMRNSSFAVLADDHCSVRGPA